jgi:predicted anti-sigma-YlaC factor YlaD
MMNCDRFRRNLENNLKHTSRQTLSEEMRSHVSSCSDCQAYQTSLLSLHTALLEIAREKLPEGLSAQLKAIGEFPQREAIRLSWIPEMKRAIPLLGLAVVMILAQLLPPGVSAIVEVVVLTIGLTTLMSNILKPVFVGQNGIGLKS